MRKTKVRIVGDPDLAKKVTECIEERFDIINRQEFNRAVDSDYAHAPGITIYLEIKRPTFAGLRKEIKEITKMEASNRE